MRIKWHATHRQQTAIARQSRSHLRLLSVGSGSLLSKEGRSLFGELRLSLVLTLLSVDLLDQDTLGSVTVTLGQSVEVSVHVLVDLASLTVLLQQSAEHTNAAHPEELLGDTSVHGTTALTVTSVVAAGLGIVANVHTSTRVHHHVLADDQTVLHKLADALAGVGEGNVVHLVGVHPNLALTALKDRGSKSLLKSEIHHFLGTVLAKELPKGVVRQNTPNSRYMSHNMFSRE